MSEQTFNDALSSLCGRELAAAAAEAAAENGRQRDAFLRLVSEAPVLSFIGGKA